MPAEVDSLEGTSDPLPALSPPSKVSRTIECVALFVGLPCALRIVHAFYARVPVIAVLILLGFGVALVLQRDPHFDAREALRWRWSRSEVRRILFLFATSAALLAGTTWALTPERFLDFPKEHLRLWMFVMVLYPVVSVLPQELLFRVFFFQRYQPLLGRGWSMVVGSALAFGVAHILFGSAYSVILSAVGGAYFGWTYARTRSIWLTSFEHALYGCLVFTIGLGRFFYAGSDVALGP